MHAWPNHACLYMCLIWGFQSLSRRSLVGGQQHTHALCAQRYVPVIMCAQSIDLVLINHSTQIKKLYLNPHNPNLKHIAPNMA